jgi:Lecithin:cholesterol acyltransferase
MSHRTFRYFLDKKSNNLVLNPLAGVTIKAMGYTNETREASNCGFESISNLIPVCEVLNPSKYKMFTYMKNELLWRGYKLGINVFGLPYEWRAPFTKNDMTRRFAKLVKNVAQINRKRVIIVAHSMGNLNTVNNLANLDQSFKDKFIEKYFAIAAPYLGAPTAFKYMIEGNSDFFMLGFGMNLWLFKKMAAFVASPYDLMPRTPWITFKDTYWMKSIKNRISKEKNMPIKESVPASEDIVSRLFPDPSVTCSEIMYAIRENKCLSGLDDFYEVANIGGKVVTLENINESFTEFCFDPTAADL